MRITFGKTLTATALSLALATQAQAAGTVHIYNWSDYIGETTLADFE
ncbi:spermidine/putrescine ABC transporter substrate-binding protein PotF, partial [Pseudomonas sp. CrR25]|nr:spermidine/putrescine ABC transporter substrate-binding protein PotF [Pseudomonas sp. CrR25]